MEAYPQASALASMTGGGAADRVRGNSAFSSKRLPMADDASAHPDVLNQAAQGQLKSIVERIERLEIEKAEVAEQIKEVFAEAKGNGFDVKILRKVVRIRKQDRAKRLEEDAILDLYLSAIGEI
jgi:uncharacterized protein (UPF0335 family)